MILDFLASHQRSGTADQQNQKSKRLVLQAHSNATPHQRTVVGSYLILCKK